MTPAALRGGFREVPTMTTNNLPPKPRLPLAQALPDAFHLGRLLSDEPRVLIENRDSSLRRDGETYDAELARLLALLREAAALLTHSPSKDYPASQADLLRRIQEAAS